MSIMPNEHEDHIGVIVSCSNLYQLTSIVTSKSFETFIFYKPRFLSSIQYLFFFLSHTPPPEIYTLPLPDALPIWGGADTPGRAAAQLPRGDAARGADHRDPAHDRPPAAPADAGRRHPGQHRQLLAGGRDRAARSEEHTSELQSPCNLVCRLLLEKK